MMRELDSVRLTREIAGFPAGTTGALMAFSDKDNWAILDVTVYDTIDVPLDAVEPFDLSSYPEAWDGTGEEPFVVPVGTTLATSEIVGSEKGPRTALLSGVR